MNYVDTLKGMGYTVDVAAEGYQDDGYENEDGSKVEPQTVPTIYSITGFGVDVQVSENDTDTLDRLCNTDAYAAREAQFNADSEQPISADKLFENNLAVQVALGDITQDEADEQKKAWYQAQQLPNAVDMFDQAATAIQSATSLDDIKAAFAQLQKDIAPFVTQAEAPAKSTTKKK
jgi:hypothetical protein